MEWAPFLTFVRKVTSAAFIKILFVSFITFNILFVLTKRACCQYSYQGYCLFPTPTTYFPVSKEYSIWYLVFAKAPWVIVFPCKKPKRVSLKKQSPTHAQIPRKKFFLIWLKFLCMWICIVVNSPNPMRAWWFNVILF